MDLIEWCQMLEDLPKLKEALREWDKKIELEKNTKRERLRRWSIEKAKRKWDL